ncbi:hypothetical protein AALP_AA5G066400 [Arabis alpina]|nr:hypothetical protein AALP_AA5G066400 [Arabis alpina]
MAVPTAGPDHQFGDVGLDLLDAYMQPTGLATSGGIDDGGFFWEGYTTQNGGLDHHNMLIDIAEPIENALTANHNATTGTNETSPIFTNDLSGEFSSTGSSGYIALMADFEAEYDLAIIPTPPQSPLLQIPAGVEEVVGNGVTQPDVGQTVDPQPLTIIPPEEEAHVVPTLVLSVTYGLLPNGHSHNSGIDDGGSSSEENLTDGEF